MLREAAAATPDPERALTNLLSFAEGNPGWRDLLAASLRPVSLLFSFSQFLSNYSISHPEVLFDVLADLEATPGKEGLSAVLSKRLADVSAGASGDAGRFSLYGLDPFMTAVRRFRTEEILRITFRDILRKADIVETMLELSCLADVIIGHSLSVVRESLARVYGGPQEDAFSVISLGKLGGEELNFSSDVDLIFVYGTEAGETSGVMTSHGVVKNRISNHEYYCKVGETLSKFLSLNTESGFAYRVDLRLRPEGQRGDIAQALRGYEIYYESWGRAWERAMMIRGRHTAGDDALGKDFLEMVRPFVYRKYLDYSAIEEIRNLKTRIDSTFKKGDIKRGHGGIREIEFFVQALQLIYGGREPLLRERSTLKALHMLLQKALVGQEDYSTLSENYRYLRTLEHRLQQLNDLQTHAIPSAPAELNALSGKMGHNGAEQFIRDLERRRTRVREVYDSLFAGKREEPAATSPFFSEEMTDAEMRESLVAAGLKDPDRAVRSIKAVRDGVFSFQTLRGRRLLGEILPAFVDSALKSRMPETVLNRLQSFSALLSANESYLDVFTRNRQLIETLTSVFAQSEYLSKMLMNRPQYLEIIGWQGAVRKSILSLINEIRAGVSEGHSLNDAVRIVRQTEEIRLGLLFLQGEIGIEAVIRGLSRTAEAVLRMCAGHALEEGGKVAVIGFGKIGGREITFNSDLDLIFTTEGDVTTADTKTAERFLRMLLSYTKEGIAYRVDTRLRPEGSKGPLVSSLESFRNYYDRAAAFWEFQALLKARPVAGNPAASRLFTEVAREKLSERGRQVSPSDIRQMRDRILRELAKESSGYDIKLGPGGIEEIEFAIQYLQLINCKRNPKLLVQGTVKSIERLGKAGVIGAGETAFLKGTYLFYRTLETFLRLSGESTLKKEGEPLRIAAGFMGVGDTERFADDVETKRRKVRELFERYLSDQ